jgi:hypothetical protein
VLAAFPLGPAEKNTVVAQYATLLLGVYIWYHMYIYNIIWIYIYKYACVYYNYISYVLLVFKGFRAIFGTPGRTWGSTDHHPAVGIDLNSL